MSHKAINFGRKQHLMGVLNHLPGSRRAVILWNTGVSNRGGPFRCNVDHSPIENVYLRKVMKSNSGELFNQTQKTIATQQAASNASACRM